MKRGVVSLSTILSLILAILIVPRHSQSFVSRGDREDIPQLAGSQNLKKIVKKIGWRVPGEDDFTIIARVQNMEVDGVKIKRKTLQSSTEPLFELEACSVGNNGDIFISSALCVVRNLSAYGVKDRVFAYEATLVLTNVYRDGTRESTGASYNLFYSDEDGNGTYETRYSGGELIIPDWVKTNKTKS